MSFLDTDVGRKYARRRAGFQQHRDTSSYQIFLQGYAPREIRAIQIETFGEYAPFYATVNPV
jgi:hypothetical protein